MRRILTANARSRCLATAWKMRLTIGRRRVRPNVGDDLRIVRLTIGRRRVGHHLLVMVAYGCGAHGDLVRPGGLHVLI